jgi:hypothetical protein
MSKSVARYWDIKPFPKYVHEMWADWKNEQTAKTVSYYGRKIRVYPYTCMTCGVSRLLNRPVTPAPGITLTDRMISAALNADVPLERECVPPGPTPPVTVPDATPAGGEMVNHPSHYTPGPYEVYKVLLAWELQNNAHLYQTVKYLARCGKKHTNPLEDLKKAHWWLGLEIWILEGKDPNEYNGPKG